MDQIIKSCPTFHHLSNQVVCQVYSKHFSRALLLWPLFCSIIALVYSCHSDNTDQVSDFRQITILSKYWRNEKEKKDFLYNFLPQNCVILYEDLVLYSKTSILEYQKMYSKIEVIYEVFMNFGPQQKNYL